MDDYIISLTTKTVCFVNKSGGIIVKKGGISMGSSYKEKVVEEISKCENEVILKFLYSMIQSFKKKWGI